MKSIALWLRQQQAELVGDSLDDGRICVYGGTRPVNVDAALPDDVVELAEGHFSSPAATPADDAATIRGYDIQSDPDTNGDGEATFYRTYTKTGRAVEQGRIGLRIEGAEDSAQPEMIVMTTRIIPHIQFDFNSYSHQVN